MTTTQQKSRLGWSVTTKRQPLVQQKSRTGWSVMAKWAVR